jgi:hypothetical protein
MQIYGGEIIHFEAARRGIAENGRGAMENGHPHRPSIHSMTLMNPYSL